MSAEVRQPVEIIPAACTLGEGPVWDDRLSCLWWTDIHKSQLLRWDWANRSFESVELPERLGSLGLTTDPLWLVCAFASGFALFRPDVGELRWLARPEAEYRGVRLNDGRVDPLGNFWSGSMVENAALAPTCGGSLYRLDSHGELDVMLDGIGISNSICFPADGSRLFFADTLQGDIDAYELRPDGTLGDKQPFAKIARPACPDGSEVDAAGRLWNAEWGGARLRCYGPDGSPVKQLVLPVSQPTCLTFGGPGLDHIFVTSAREGLSADQLAGEPLAGHTLVYRTGDTGLRAPRFHIEYLLSRRMT